MLFWNKQTEPKVDINQLQYENAQLKARNNDLKEKLDALTEATNSEFSTATNGIDFNAMNAFSVERTHDGSRGVGFYRTVIGYMLAEPAITTEEDKVVYKDVVREWTLHCSHVEHERLVKKFNEYIASKK